MMLVTEDLQREAGVQFRVVHPSALEPAVLVVLDQVVIGVAGKGQRTEAQRIHRRQPHEPQVGVCCREMRKVEGDQVVAQDKGRAVGEIVQLRQRRRQTAAGMHQAMAGIRPHCAKCVDATVLLANLQVQRQPTEPEGLVSIRCLCIHTSFGMQWGAAKIVPSSHNR